MRFVILFFVLAALSACSEGQKRDGKPPQQAFVLALSWQPAFCETAERRPECRTQSAGRIDAASFSLHGLWPQPGNAIYCDVSREQEEASRAGRWREIEMARLPDPLWRRLISAMPGTRSHLHRHEWIKHGTCMQGVNEDGYFRVSLDLIDRFNDSALRALFAANIGRNLSADAIRAAFEQDFGPASGRRLRIACADDGERRLIREITIGLKGQVVETELTRETVASLIAAAAPTDPGCPGGIVDAAGFQ